MTYLKKGGSRGSRNSKAKVTEDDVKEIRNSQGIKPIEIAQRYGISRSMVSKIMHRVYWTHI